MKKFPFGVLWGGMLLAKGFSGNAAEIFEFFIGSASRGVMVMNEEAGGYRDFQKYSFSTHDYEHFEQLFGQITQTHCPLPAILKWFQSVKPDSDEGIRIKRWLTVTDSRHQNNYNTLGPQGGGGLGYSKVDAGVLSLPEVLLFQALAPFAGGAVAFFDPFLYNRKFWLRPVSQGVLPGSDIVIKTWVTHFFWRSEVTSFISGVGSDANDIEMKVVAEYKNDHLRWYRVKLSGLPGLVFKRVMVKNDRQNDQSVTPKRGMRTCAGSARTICRKECQNRSVRLRI